MRVFVSSNNNDGEISQFDFEDGRSVTLNDALLRADLGSFDEVTQSNSVTVSSPTGVVLEPSAYTPLTHKAMVSVTPKKIAGAVASN